MVQASKTTPPDPSQIGKVISSPERIPATLRLGPQNVPEDGREANSSQQKRPQQSLERINTGQAEPKAKRKPGRPAGRANVQESPLKLTGSNLRKRKVSQPKPTTGRHKTGTTTANQSTKAGARTKTKNGSPGSSLLPNS
ncbi:hypothetical protein DY000_02005195 [Brassica cretica]|uniref:Uncharacterized protein n=1 Tax=Brassica cretica TaxID=69181 RepID=A0ABQ7CG43_BRACR|nr:hypothetical protein DY000_02005195 [Brassica cretica]